jgi:hypothetical protein
VRKIRRGDSISDWRARVRDRVEVDENGCWRWQLCKCPQGYGLWNVTLESDFYRAHRAAYRIFKGEIPIGLEIDHLCKTRDCVNPNHLEPVTGVENSRRIRSKFCQENHTGPESRSGRKNGCPICKKTTWDKWYAANRENHRRWHCRNYLENKEHFAAKGREKHVRAMAEKRRLHLQLGTMPGVHHKRKREIAERLYRKREPSAPILAIYARRAGQKRQHAHWALLAQFG